MGGEAPPATQSARDEIHAVTVTYKCYTDLTRIMPVFWVKMKKWGWVKSGRRRRSDLTQSPFFHFPQKTGIFLSKTQVSSFTIYTILYIERFFQF